MNNDQAKIISELSGTNAKQCMKCGKCSGRCPMFDAMDIKPHQFVSLIAKGQTEKLLESKSIWYCLSCMACVERCPRGVAPAAVIEAVRESVIRVQGQNQLKAESVPEFVDEEFPQQILVSAFRKYNR